MTLSLPHSGLVGIKMGFLRFCFVEGCFFGVVVGVLILYMNKERGNLGLSEGLQSLEQFFSHK